MSEDDKTVYRQARPYIVGLVALLHKLVQKIHTTNELAFDEAEAFMREFEKRNGVDL